MNGRKNGGLLDARMGSILTGVAINLVAGSVVLLLAKVCLPERIEGPGSWKIWISLLISVLAVGTVIWLGVNQRMELKAMQGSQRAVDELAAELRQRAADATGFRDQLEAQIEGLGQRIDEIGGKVEALDQVRGIDANAVRGMLNDRLESIEERIEKVGEEMASSLNALEEAKIHEAAAARKLMLDQVAGVSKRIDELKSAAPAPAAPSAPNPAVEALKVAVGRLQQDLAELRKSVERQRQALAAPSTPEQGQPTIIPAQGAQPQPPDPSESA